ncbi:MAG: hypothetical protein HY402_02105 [Elusimicrobia bacterium]|nr:hypothetical protein [Elusimicrobiota bacterium]
MGFGKDLWEFEVRRKAFHLLGLVYLAIYAALGRQGALWAIGIFGLWVWSTEWLRLRHAHWNERILEWFRSVSRGAERMRPSGIGYGALGVWLVIFFFSSPAIVAASVLLMVFGDAASALVGTRFGRHPIAGCFGKSWEGFSACLVTCFFLGRLFFPWTEALGAALTVSVLESAPLPLDDNLWTPLGAACAFHWFS